MPGGVVSVGRGDGIGGASRARRRWPAWRSALALGRMARGDLPRPPPESV